MVTATIWNPGTPVSTANADGSYKSQSFNVIADSAGPVLFTLTTFAYGPGTGSLMVFINGSKQSLSKTPTPDFTETSAGSFTITGSLRNGDFVEAYALVGGSATQSAAASAAAAAISATAAQNYLIAIQALTPPSLPLSIATGGTGQTTKAAAFTALSPLTTTGDILVFGAGGNQRLATATDGSIMVTEAAISGGHKYYPDKPMLERRAIVDTVVGLADAGKTVVRTVVSPATSGTVTIDAGATLYPGWKVWIQNGNSYDGATAVTKTNGSVTIALTGASDFFMEPFNSVLSLPIGGCVGIEFFGVVNVAGTPTALFRVFTSKSARVYFKLRLQAAANTSLGVPTVGLNDRAISTLVENTSEFVPNASPPFIFLSPGTWQFRATTVHSGAALTRLQLWSQTSGTLLLSSMSSPANNLQNIITGKVISSPASGGISVYFREWFSAATGTLGLAINDGNPEIYGECEFWRE